MRDRLLAVLALLGFLLICFAASATRRPSHTPPPIDYGAPKSVATTERVDQKSISDTPPKPYHFRVPHWVVMDLIYLGLAAVFALLLWFIIKVVPYLSVERRRRRRRRALAEQDEAPAEFDDETQHRLARTFAEALTGFDVGDANRAIVACWIRLEQIAESAGFARQDWETSTELVTRWLSRAELPREPLSQLSGLYREARYSGHPMSRQQIEQARATLTQLRIAFQPVGPTDSVIGADRGPVTGDG